MRAHTQHINCIDYTQIKHNQGVKLASLRFELTPLYNGVRFPKTLEETKFMRKGLLFFVLVIFTCTSSLANNSQSVGNNNFKEGSPELFAAEILKLAYKKNYEKLQSYFSWSWNEFYGSFEPDYPWRNLRKSKSLNHVLIHNSKKSKVHHDLYDIRVEYKTEDGTKGSNLKVIKVGGGYKLAVQANGSLTGNAFIGLGYSIQWTEKILKKVGYEYQRDGGKLIVQLKGKDNLQIYLDSETLLVSSLDINIPEIANSFIPVYLVVFDAEKNYTVKLKRRDD